jgi:hypothetical protein
MRNEDAAATGGESEGGVETNAENAQGEPEAMLEGADASEGVANAQ